MIARKLLKRLEEALSLSPAVALLGPRQVGKTTLAKLVSKGRSSVYLDLEDPEDLAKLEDPKSYLQTHLDKLVIIDEIQREAGLFKVLRGLIDSAREKGLRTGRYLLLGSASIDLLKQSSESLAGRISYLELTPLTIEEAQSQKDLWVRGGFPESFLAADDRLSLIWRKDFIKTYLERDIPQLGPRIPAETLRRFWTMLANNQGELLNASRLAKALAVDGKTVGRYIDLLVDLLLVRRLPAYHINLDKRLIKSPKTYVRDSGLGHALLGIKNYDELMGHIVSGGSWEGYVIENISAAVPDSTVAYFYRTAGGAEIDLVLELPGGEIVAIEIKRNLAPKIEKGFYSALEDISPCKAIIVYPGEGSYPKQDGIIVAGLKESIKMLS